MTYPAATVEFQPLTVTVDGTPVTDYQVCIAPWTTPSTALTGWVSNTVLNGKHGVMIQGLTPETYNLWVRVTDNPETPVVCSTTIEVTP